MRALGPWRGILTALTFALPGFLLGVTVRFVHLEIPHILAALIFGIAILAAAFLIAWTAEAAQVVLKSTLIVVLVAFIAVLPEYAVDMVLTGKAGYNLEEYGSFPLANMTGANRLLIGWGWPLVYLIAWLKTGQKYIVLHKNQAVELVVLGLATGYVFVIWAKGNLGLVDTLVLGGLFVGYLLVSRRIQISIPEPEKGPAHLILNAVRGRKTWLLLLLFGFSGLAIVAAAEPFSENLISAGKVLNIDEFILVQWVAPFASEAPEVTIAAVFAAMLLASYGLGILISSKINQWTLLVGMIPLAFAVSHFIYQGSIAPLPLDSRQSEELFLTSAQSWFALMVLANLRFSWFEASTLFVLFTTQLALPSSEIRHIFSFIYLSLAGVIFIKNPKRLWLLGSYAWKTITTAPKK